MVCRQRRLEADVQRCGRRGEGAWYLGRGVGRGLWWCREGDCADKVSLAHASRALKRSLSEVDAVALLQLVQRSKTFVVVEE